MFLVWILFFSSANCFSLGPEDIYTHKMRPLSAIVYYLDQLKFEGNYGLDFVLSEEKIIIKSFHESGPRNLNKESRLLVKGAQAVRDIQKKLGIGGVEVLLVPSEKKDLKKNVNVKMTYLDLLLLNMRLGPETNDHGGFNYKGYSLYPMKKYPTTLVFEETYQKGLDPSKISSWRKKTINIVKEYSKKIKINPPKVQFIKEAL